MEDDRLLLHRRDSAWMKPVLDSAPEGVLVEQQGTVLYINQRYVDLLGYRNADELRGRPVTEIIEAREVQRLIDFGRRRLRGESVPNLYDFRARRRDGKIVRLQAAVAVTIIERRPCITTFVRPFYEQAPAHSEEPLQGTHSLLSPREREVMQRILDGERIKEIALCLNLSEKTIATHRARLLKKMGLADNRQLFQYALRHRLVHWA